MGSRKVYIRMRELERVLVRQWGLPHMMHEGKVWRFTDTEGSHFMACIVRAGEGKVRVEKARVVFNDGPPRFPRGWRTEMRRYLRAWPDSAREIRRLLEVPRG